ncbi:discoidin domain-containing protein [Humibacter sp. RRB41]|uniref:discoidin domain-containing protein n=1 Tax=Humibacter sp. RRB41 TaxID=2919946 RepID=UPI001FA99527|nr:discoidin domain-containing protein [Humibacter sp. RRB41]
MFGLSRRRGGWAAAAATAAVIAASLVPAHAALADTTSTTPTVTKAVAIDKTTTSGFIHPGVGVDAGSLETTRNELVAGAEPWTSYYQGMLATSYASTTLGSANQGSGDGVPAENEFNSVDESNKLGQDSEGAYTQAILYYLTGNPVYRENAMKIIRIWSHMDPAGYKFFADAEIKTGPFVYRIMAAAELLRYTSVVPSTDGYPLVWTAQDTADFTNNFAVPMVDTMDYGNAWYMNQGTLPLEGAMASYIFTNNTTRYDQAVEWFTMNSTAPDQDVNGALGAMYRLIDKKSPDNPYGYSFVDHLEMGRDQAHAGDDVLTLTTLARLVNTQGTKLDPKAGTVSTKRNAVDPYTFLGDRLLAGTNAFFGFMAGYSIPWVDITQQGGKLAQAYRGRWNETLNEVYYIYKYQEHVDVAKAAPAVQQEFEQRDGALYYNLNVNEIGTKIGSDGLQSFWGGTLTGDDYWLSIPAAAKGEKVPQPDPNVSFAQKASVISGSAKTTSDGNATILRASDGKKGTTLAVRTMQYGALASYSPVAIRVRTTSVSTLSVTAQPGAKPYQTVTVPDTGGQWRMITYDLDASVVSAWANGGNNIVYYTFSGGRGTIDLDYVVPNAASAVTPPLFQQGASTTIVGIAGVPLDASLAATDSNTNDTVAYTATGTPRGASVGASDGELSWSPTKHDVGDHTLIVQADDGTTATALKVTLRIAKNRADAVKLAEAGYDSSMTYTNDTEPAFDAAVAAAKAVLKTASDSDFAAALAAVQKAVAGLRLLTPRSSDGTLDYVGIATSTLPAGTLGYLTDDDNYTFPGDLSVNSFTVDFGRGYRVASTAFDLQARQTFGNRSQGANVYGSNDDSSWTKLTTKETTDTNRLETLPVASSLTGKAFRFLKVQVDDPGVPTDPNFPGIFDLAEFHVHGSRQEAVDSIATASISSNDAEPGIAGNGDTVKVAFTSDGALSDVVGAIAGVRATITGSGTTWTASAILPDTITSGVIATFAIDYTTADGKTADPLEVTTDGSKVFLSNSDGLITNVPSIATPVSPTGDVETSKTPYFAKMFDDDPTTFSDVGPVNGQYYITLDFGDGGSVALSRAELLVRQDSNGTGRAGGLNIQGSNDQSTWTTITNNAQGTLDWQTLTLRPGTSPVAYRYLKIANNNWINIAELRLFGNRVAPPQDSVISAHLGSTDAEPGIVVGGDTVNLDFTTSEAITDVDATIDGSAATVIGSGTSWRASLQEPSDAATGRLLTFRITYAGPNGEERQALTRTTDASSVFLTTNNELIANPGSLLTAVTSSGQPDTANQKYVSSMFDGSAATFSDIGPVSGQYYEILDAGAGRSISLDHAELLVRQDANGLNRAAGLQVQGSNDLTTWTQVTSNAVGTLGWQTWERRSGTAVTAYRYLRIANNNWINIAELRLFGSIS